MHNSFQSKRKSIVGASTSLLTQLRLGSDGIYSHQFWNKEQSIEIAFREKVARATHDNPIAKISENHSVPVMDFEVSRFLSQIPYEGRIIDVGGCWGWHWRNLPRTRSDVQIFIVDFVRANLRHAKALLGDSINQKVFLIHCDATDLLLPDESFDGYWSVQALQHVVSFEKALNEGRRVLKQGGIFANYSLNDATFIRWIYRMMRRPYCRKGLVEGAFFLARASREQKQMIESIFQTEVHERLSEILYKPELRLYFSGRESSWLGQVDAQLSGAPRRFDLKGMLARQRSFHCQKQ